MYALSYTLPEDISKVCFITNVQSFLAYEKGINNTTSDAINISDATNMNDDNNDAMNDTVSDAVSDSMNDTVNNSINDTVSDLMNNAMMNDAMYKDSIHTKLDFNIKNSPVLTALESPFNYRKYISQRNRYEIAFSIAKTAINVALETNKDAELITSSNVIKLRDASRKKRIKAVTKLSKGKALNEVMNIVQEADHSETSSRQQCRCLLCKKPGYY
ncbi:15813_t:CDS:2 [Racocetra persica]|uniref:15813_t:CDS:1 n=1 Tax=Racocetra persica TaxID=160502 RepID=A0ACA9L455_9GLOM|nr:15813_t:CDS:2 [Racocetra persica]